MIDQLIGRIDSVLRSLTGVAPSSAGHLLPAEGGAADVTAAGGHNARPSPADALPATTLNDADLNDAERRHVTGLMRVNHAGEVCAQALYLGQALTAQDDRVRNTLRKAATEESDHLRWCRQRLAELGGKPSALDPVWYGSSFALGAVVGLLGDKVSLGFVEATEDRVVQHLQAHEARLPAADERTKAVLVQMRADEARHGAQAMAAGGQRFPEPIKRAMAMVAGVMTALSYRV